MSTQPQMQKVRAIFDQAVEQPPGERDAFIDRECGDDIALRSAVRELLTAHEQAGDFLADPTIRPEPIGAENIDPFPPGSRVGAYTIVKPLGEGGFSCVYLAEQDPPLRRRVALKFIK